MSEDTYGIATHLLCGHWIYIQKNQIIDGCPKCRQSEMRDNKDRHAPRKR